MTIDRSILHIDMDAFYVSVELLRHPELRGLPVVVGGTGGRGVVAAASYEARRFGIRSAISSAVARKLCPDAVFIAPDISHYVEFSQKLHTIFESFTPLVEQISIDEAFLDVTGASLLMGDAVSIAWALRERVVTETQLTCSVGVAPNKFLAKLASEHAKPRATAAGVQRGYQVFEVKRGHELEFLLPLPVQSLWGVGPATLAKLEAIGVRLVADLAELDVDIVCAAVGDVNGDELDDVYIGSASGKVSKLLIQNARGELIESESKTWNPHKVLEDIDAIFVDSDNDGDNDLYVVSGGNEFSPNSSTYLDRLYINDSNGNFEFKRNLLPDVYESGSVVRPYDFDNDGDVDIVVAMIANPEKGVSLWRNDGQGNFKEENKCQVQLTLMLVHTMMILQNLKSFIEYFLDLHLLFKLEN